MHDSEWTSSKSACVCVCVCAWVGIVLTKVTNKGVYYQGLISPCCHLLPGKGKDVKQAYKGVCWYLYPAEVHLRALAPDSEVVDVTCPGVHRSTAVAEVHTDVLVGEGTWDRLLTIEYVWRVYYYDV